ncbi:MAG: site-2 protease family protein [Planctomycetes bacterium]|nr:site-2 protease family protein [Planctomycetota bacterium]HPF12911.1 site-2 protease family protein [Planctomycetota bacterium]
MKWSYKIGTFAGIGVFVHSTFLLLLAWILGSYVLSGQGVADTVVGIGFILALFGCVLLHEFGHALTAKRYGIRTRDITLLPIGGLARLERMPEDPRQEMVVAFAGPAVNGVIALLLFAILYLTGTLQPWAELNANQGSFLQRIMLVNIVLLVFNLIPAFPMDGGRVLRAFLALRMPYAAATQRAAAVGQALALFFGLVGLLYNPVLMFIALFVWIGAGQEASMAMMKDSLGGIPVNHAMVTHYDVLAPTDTLSRAIDLTLHSTQRDFPVLDGDQVVGMLLQKDLMRGLASGERAKEVSEVMHKDVPFAQANEMLEAVFQRLAEGKCPTIPVTQKGQLVGLVSVDNIGEYIAIQSALSGARRAGTQRVGPVS